MLCLSGGFNARAPFNDRVAAMPRRTLKRLLPAAQSFRSQRSLRAFGPFLNDPNLWHLNRYSVSTAAFVGLFFAFMPVPVQTLLAVATGILVRCNLPLAVILVWISNPLTMPPMFFASHRLGSWLLGRESQPLRFEFTGEWFMAQIAQGWQPLLLGSVILGAFAGLTGFLAMRYLWRLSVVRRWEQRKERRRRLLELERIRRLQS